MSLKKVELFTHEIVKRLGAHELGRVAFEIPTGNPEQPACRILCANAASEISIGTYPEHRYARMVVSTMAEPNVDILSEVFQEFFHPAAQIGHKILMRMEGYLESPEL